MAFVHGKGTVLKLDSSAGSLVDLSAYLDNVSFPENLETAETTTFGAAAKTYIPGLKDSTLSFGGKYDATLDAHMNGVLAALAAGTLATASVEYGPAGSTGGFPKYTCEAIVTGYTVEAGVGDLVTFSAELQVTGAVTRTTW